MMKIQLPSLKAKVGKTVTITRLPISLYFTRFIQSFISNIFPMNDGYQQFALEILKCKTIVKSSGLIKVKNLNYCT